MAAPLLTCFDELAERLVAAPRILLALDFDGTLAPIVDHPERAALPSSVRVLLEGLAKTPGIAVAIISGRTLGDVRTRIALPNLYYAGDHGVEIEGIDLRFVETSAQASRIAVMALASALKDRLTAVDGCFVEIKGFTASIHYRRVPSEKVDHVLDVVADAFRSHDQSARLTHGHMVAEIRPASPWHKGDAIRLLAEHLNVAPAHVIYVGDDRTDEDAFTVLPEAVTVRIAEGFQAWLVQLTSANYWVAGRAEIECFLHWLTNLRVPATC